MGFWNTVELCVFVCVCVCVCACMCVCVESGELADNHVPVRVASSEGVMESYEARGGGKREWGFLVPTLGNAK